MRLRSLCGLLAAALLAGGPSLLSAAGMTSLVFTSQVVDAAGPRPQAQVLLNGVRLVSFSDPAAKRLADELAARLTRAALAGARADQVSARGDDRQVTISLAGVDMITVDKQYAFAVGSTLEGLAGQWATRLREAFSLPYLSVSVDKLIVPLGESRRISFLGNMPAPPEGFISSAVGTAASQPDGTLLVTGTGVGSASLSVRCAGASLELPVQVMKWAGQVTPTAAAEVTGLPAPRWAVERAALAAAYLAAAVEPGAQLEVTPPRAAGTLSLGATTTVSAGVSITGAAYLPVRRDLTVSVRNVALAPAPPQLLMVSNNPERLRAYGLWYEAQLERARPARLLYHHVNSSGQPADLVLELANTSLAPARVHIVEASAGPSADEIYVGHLATRAYMERQAEGVGYIVTIRPQSRYVVARHRLPAGQIASGVDDLRLLDGESVMVRVRLTPPGEQTLYGTLGDYRPSQAGEQYVFPEPAKQVEVSYTVGGRWAFVTIGRHAIAGRRDGERLAGNYGVLYEVAFHADNPTDRAVSLELGMIAAGGACRGVLLVDGKPYESGLIQPAQEQVVTTIPLAAHAKRTIRVQVMPQSGSNYPAQLFLRRDGYKLSGM